MNETQQPEFPVNIFALPNQTTVLFALIVVVFLATVLLGSLTPSPICTWPLALGLLVLPLRAILKRPEHEKQCLDLAPAGEEFAALNQAIATHTEALNLPRKPHLLISSQDKLLYAFGSFRHWYFAVGQQTAQTMQADLADPESAPTVDAKLIHELYHFRTGDHLQLGYAGELLRINFLLMAWAAMFFLGLGLLLIVATHDFLQFDAQAMLSQMTLTPEMEAMLSGLFPSPEQMAEIREKAAQINLNLVITFAFSAIWPFVAVGLLIWKIYWPRLWRLREFYADAGMVHQQGQMLPALSVVTRLPLSKLKHHHNEITRPQQHKRRVFSNQGLNIANNLKKLRDGARLPHVLKEISCALRSFPGEYHPNSATRIAAILNPNLVFDSWKEIAVLVGSLMLLLEILLLAPFTFLLVGNWPMHFATLTTVFLVALNYLVPTIARGESARVGLLKIVGVVGGLRFLLILAIISMLVIMLIAVPDVLHETLCIAVANVAGYAGYSTTTCFEDLQSFVIEAAIKNLAQAIAMPVLIIGALLLISFLVRRILTWYSLPDAKRRLIKVAYMSITVVSLFWGLTILPFVTDLILRPAEILTLSTLFVEGLGVLIAAVSSVLFIRADQKYAKRCPECGEIIPGNFRPGKQCCGKNLHPWLVTEHKL